MKATLKLIDYMRGTEVLPRYGALTRESVLCEDECLRKRNENLKSLLCTLKRHNTFYSAKLRQISDAEILLSPAEVLATLPIMDKKTLDEHRQTIFCPVPFSKVHPKKTGGSTGTPFRYFLDGEYVSQLWARIYSSWNRHSGYEIGMPFITIAGSSLRPVGSASKWKETLYHRLQNNYFIPGDFIRAGMSFHESKAGAAVLLYGYPSSILALIAANPNFPGKCKKVRAIFTTSEQLLPQTRFALQDAFGVPVFDMYGANDGGLLSCECRLHQGYHFNMDTCIVEAWKNEQGESELLLTNLLSYSFPFIRYRVGDLASVATDPCSCGLQTHRIVDLRGRSRDLIRLKHGGVLHGSIINKLLFELPEVRAYRVVQEADYSVNVHISTRSQPAFEHTAIELKKLLLPLIPSSPIRILNYVQPNVSNQKVKLIECHVH